jgi:exonuclease VII small subunit
MKLSKEQRWKVVKALMHPEYAEDLSSPEELHAFMLNWNWDYGIAEPEMVLDHPSCDKGTALLMYFLGGAGYHRQFSSREEVPDIHIEGKASTNPNVTPEMVAKWSQAKNWKEVEKFVGKQAGEKLPNGYYYDKNGVIYRPRGQAKDTVPLQVAEDGTFQITTQVSNRISNARMMGRNFEKAYGGLKEGYWIHHLIPDAVVRNNALAKFARSLGYDLDRSSNLLGLADKETWAKIAKGDIQGTSGNGYSDKVGHWSNHKEYSKKVEGYLNDEFERLESNFGDLEKALQDPAKAKQLKKEVEQTMKDAEEYFRNLINDGKAPVTPEGRLSWNNKQTEPIA